LETLIDTSVLTTPGIEVQITVLVSWKIAFTILSPNLTTKLFDSIKFAPKITILVPPDAGPEVGIISIMRGVTNANMKNYLEFRK